MRRLQERLIEPSLDQLFTALDDMIEKLLRHQKPFHPITYSRRLLDSINKAEQAFADRILSEKFAQAMSSHGETISRASFEAVLKQQIDLGPQTLERHAAFKVMQIMRAYYEVSLPIVCTLR